MSSEEGGAEHGLLEHLFVRVEIRVEVRKWWETKLENEAKTKSHSKKTSFVFFKSVGSLLTSNNKIVNIY